MFATGLAPYRIPVLRYRRIGGPAGDRSSVPVAAFREHVRLIGTSGRTALKVSQISELLRRRHEPAEPVLAVTIDTGYPETPAAVEHLAEHGIPATVYAQPPSPGTPERMTADQLRDLAEIGEMVELGALAGSGPHLDSIPAQRARTEIEVSKRAIELAGGRPVSTFAYPHGAYDANLQQAVRAAGFDSAVAVKDAMSHPDDDPWAIARYTVGRDTEAADIEALLDGRGAPLAWVEDRLSARLARASRRARYRLLRPRG
ncbi:MAG TPA: polysaccharide deacetylase family protein [Solirubrobacteraceae bacterium]